MKQIAVIGSGTMGNGIAHVFAQTGYSVNLIDIQQTALDKAMATIGKNMDRQISKGLLSEEDKAAALGRISCHTDLKSGVRSADLVVETATENTNILTEAQVQALETAKEEKEAHGEIETHHPGFLLGQDTYYVGYIKGVGKIYEQTGIDTYSNVGFAKLYNDKTALTAADFLNDKVLPFFDGFGLSLLRTLTDRGTEYCGKPENHPYQLFLS